MKLISLLILSLVYFNNLFGQNFSGVIMNKKTNLPIEYVNIGVIGKNVGTVSGTDGIYKLDIDSQFDSDTLMISCIGYYPCKVKVVDYKKAATQNIYLNEKIVELDEVIVKPKKFKHKLLGITTTSKAIQAGFKENQLGYELGILMKVKKSAVLEKLIVNIATCTYDTIFYRVNIYKVKGNMSFENILQKPIYIQLPRDATKEKIELNLMPYNIKVYGNFLVTLEHVKNLGDGYLHFCSNVTNKTYYRKTSQSNWETVPIGVSISVDAQVEK